MRGESSAPQRLVNSLTRYPFYELQGESSAPQRLVNSLTRYPFYELQGRPRPVVSEARPRRGRLGPLIFRVVDE